MFTQFIEFLHPLTQAVRDLWSVNPILSVVFAVILLAVGGGLLFVLFLVGSLIWAAILDIARNFAPLPDKNLRTINAEQEEKEDKDRTKAIAPLNGTVSLESPEKYLPQTGNQNRTKAIVLQNGAESLESPGKYLPQLGRQARSQLQQWHPVAKFLWLLFAGAMLFMTYDALSSWHWPQTEGVVIDSSFQVEKAYTRVGLHSYDVFLAGASYAYYVNGIKYRGDTGDHINGENFSFLGDKGMLLIPNEQVAVYYNPAHPERSVLNPGKLANWFWLMVPIFLYLSFAAPWWLPFRNSLYHILHRGG
jgi:hypothetical protein